jgi:hypothetical protein
MKHYFRPGRDDFRQAILRAMPKMLSEGAAKPTKEEILATLKGMTAKTWKGDRDRVIALLIA